MHAKGDRNAAIIQLKGIIQEHSEHAESRVYLGRLYQETGDHRGAEKEFRRALELGAEPARVRPMLARALLVQGEAKKVLSDVDTEGVSDPEALAGILAARGLAHLLLKEVDEASAAFDKALATRPKFSEALLGRARLLALERKLEDGLVEIDRAIESAPDNADALMLRGDFLRALGRTEEAQLAYEKLAQSHADHVNALLALVSLDIGNGKLDDASARLAAVRKFSPSNPMVSYFQALIAFRRNDFPEARDSIAGILKVAPNHLPSLLLGGAVEFALGSHELAQARLKYVLDRVPANVYARRLLIASYARAGQTQKAIEALEPALKQAPQDAAILALAGEVYLQSSELEKAERYFQQAASLNPANAALRTGLGLSRLAAGEIDAATADLESASQLDPSGSRSDVILVAAHLQRGQFDQALKAARALERKQPDSPMSHNLLAAAYVGKKDLPSARRSLEKALELQPAYTPAAANLAQIDLQNGDKASARKRFEDVIARDRSNVQAYIALAALGPRIGASKEETEGWLVAAHKQSPGTIHPLVMLARFHFQSGEPKKALELVEKALAGAPENPEVLDLAGQVQLAAGEKNRALATFVKWTAVQPSAMSFFRLGTAHLANEDDGAANSSLRKAVDYRPEFPEAQLLLAQTEIRAGRFGEALRIAEDLQKQAPKSPLGWLLEGDAMMRARKPAGAAKAYDRAYSARPAGPTAIKVHAAMLQDKRGSEGEARLRQWLNLEPSDVPTRLYLAEAYLASAKYKEAITEYQHILDIQPDHVVALNNLAWCYEKVKDQRAVKTARKALELRPSDPQVMDTLGWIMVERGEVTEGARMLKEASRLAPKSAEIRYHYAQALGKGGNKPAAKEELEKLLFDFPNLPWRMQVLDRLREYRG